VDADLDQMLATLLVKAQEGDQAAYESFLLEVSRVLRRYLSRRMRDSEHVEDVLQNTLLSIHRARHTYWPGRALAPWLFAICGHRLMDFYRRQRRIERLEVSAPDDFVNRVARPVPDEENERGHRVRQALARLPATQRKVIELLKIHDLSVKEAAAHTGMSESAVKVTAFRGYQTIRRVLGVS